MVDRLAQQIVLERQETLVEHRNGTVVRVGYPIDLVPLCDLGGLGNLIRDFAALNTHAAFTLRDWTGYRDDGGDPLIGDLRIEIEESSAEAPEKWASANPIPPHWYGLEKFGHRILLELIRDPEITVARRRGRPLRREAERAPGRPLDRHRPRRPAPRQDAGLIQAAQALGPGRGW
jgi:hypothetical protein